MAHARKQKQQAQGQQGGKKKQNKRMQTQLTRIKTVWITEQTAPFIEDFEVGQQIGEAGQFGKAYRCRRKNDRKIFAVKAVSKARFYRLDKDGKHRNALLAAMQGEIDVMRRIKGQNAHIVNLESVYEDKHMLYIVMEECRGGELFDRIRAKGQYNETDAAKVLKQVCDALRFMHDYHNVVHCDLKPDNILFATKKADSIIKIIDFGMAKVLPRLRALRELCGTPYYTAPEIIDGHYAHGADMWSVGVIMFVMLFGFPPFYVDPNKYYGQNEARAIYELIKKGFDPVVKKGYGPWFPKKIPVSKDARDLMAKLLTADRGKRLTAKESINHPWIQNGGVSQHQQQNDDENEQKLGANVGENVIRELTSFTNNCKLKLAVIHIFRDQFKELRPSHFNELQKIFEALDKDNDGEITYEEFQTGMTELSNVSLSKDQVKQIFSQLTANDGTKKIRFEDLLNAAVHDYLVASDERLYCAFRELDKNDDGLISTEELKKELKKSDPYGNHDELLKVIETENLDQSGEINYEDFLRTLHPNFNETPKWFQGNKNKQNNNQNQDDQKQDN